MFVWLFFGIILAVAVVLVIRGFAGADPKLLAKLLRWVGVAAGAAVAILLLFTGRGVQALMTLVAVAPLLMRWQAMWNRMKSAMGPTPGQRSAVETDFIRMELDHDSGALDGDIKGGSFAGRRLRALSLAELMDLLRECAAADPQGLPLVEAYLDRMHPDWREQQPHDAADAAAAGGGFGQAMTPEEARRILGVDADADEAAIKEAHRRLMMKNHPDQGGSTYLAAKINQAKDVLSKRR